MAKVLITPIAPQIPPFEVEGKRLIAQIWPDIGLVYYIGGGSFPERIVTILEGEVEINDYQS